MELILGLLGFWIIYKLFMGFLEEIDNIRNIPTDGPEPKRESDNKL